MRIAWRMVNRQGRGGMWNSHFSRLWRGSVAGMTAPQAVVREHEDCFTWEIVPGDKRGSSPRTWGAKSALDAARNDLIDALQTQPDAGAVQ